MVGACTKLMVIRHAEKPDKQAGIFLDRTAELGRHGLLTVADAHDCRALTRIENGGIDTGAGGFVNTAGAAGNNDSLAALKFGSRRVAGAHLGVNTEIAHLSGDQMAVLPAGVQNCDLGENGCLRCQNLL